MMYDLIIEDATLVNARESIQADIGIADGVIKTLSEDLKGEKSKKRINLLGHYVLPGCIDSHMHLWEPGLVAEPDFRAGTLAAVAGGVTTIVDHPLTIPEVLSVDIFKDKIKLGEETSYADFGLHGGVNPQNLHELSALWEEGCTAFKMFMCESGSEVSMMDSGPLLEAFKIIGSFGGTAIIHAENNSILEFNKQKLLKNNRTDYMAFVDWRLPEAEIEAIHRAVYFAERTGVRLVVLHTTVPEGVAHINQARERGVDVWVETCPHNLYFSHRDLKERGPWVTFAPPVRSKVRVEKLWRQLAAHQIHVMGSDHGPVEESRKKKGIDNIWNGQFGIPGAETLVPLMLNAVSEGTLELSLVAKILSETPAKLYGLYPQKGSFHIGSDADFTVVDLETSYILRAEDMYTSCNWIPYEGRRNHGKVTHTILRGEVIMEYGEVIGKPGMGNFIPRK